MTWLVENANGLYLLLGVIAAGLVIAWRFNQRAKYLGFAIGVLALLGLVWLLCRVVPTDRKQLEDNVEAMAQAVIAGKTDDLFKYISNDFSYRGLSRQQMHERIQAALRMQRVRDIRITKFKVEELAREQKRARTSFRVSAWEASNDHPHLMGAEADFTLEGEQWKLRTLRFYNPLVNQDREIEIPIP